MVRGQWDHFSLPPSPRWRFGREGGCERWCACLLSSSARTHRSPSHPNRHSNTAPRPTPKRPRCCPAAADVSDRQPQPPTPIRVDQEGEDLFNAPRKSIPPRNSPASARRNLSSTALDTLGSPGRNEAPRLRRRSLGGSSGKLESPMYLCNAAADQDGDWCACARVTGTKR